jgi:hypothetical protein
MLSTEGQELLREVNTENLKPASDLDAEGVLETVGLRKDMK